MFPLLRGHPNTCTYDGSKDVLGVVDMTGITGYDPILSSLIHNYSIPLVRAAFHEVFTPKSRGMVKKSNNLFFEIILI